MENPSPNCNGIVNFTPEKCSEKKKRWVLGSGGCHWQGIRRIWQSPRTQKSVPVSRPRFRQTTSVVHCSGCEPTIESTKMGGCLSKVASISRFGIAPVSNYIILYPTGLGTDCGARARAALPGTLPDSRAAPGARRAARPRRGGWRILRGGDETLTFPSGILTLPETKP